MEDEIKRKTAVNQKKSEEDQRKKNLKHWIYRGLGISGGIIAIITLFLPWWRVSGPFYFILTPLYINYNGIRIYFWEYLTGYGLEFGFVLLMIMMTVSLILIIIIGLLCFLKISRTSGTLIIIVIIASFATIGISAFLMDIAPFYYIDFPFFGADANSVWGFSWGWILLFISAFLIMFFRKLVITEEEKFHKEWKRRVKELEE